MNDNTEDILSDDNPEKRRPDDQADTKQWKLAAAIVRIMKRVKTKRLDDEEKARLWVSIRDQSIGNVKGNGENASWLKYGIAASIAAFCLLSIAILYFSTANLGNKLMRTAKGFHENMVDMDSLSLVLDGNSILHLQNESTLHFGDSTLTVLSVDGEKKNIAMNQSGEYTTMAVPYGKRTELILPDGTKVWLNAGSYLTFPKKFDTEKREVYLQGEAFFEVSHLKGKPFYVYADDMQIKVLGTSFNVSSYTDDNTSSMSLLEGRVELSPLGDAEFEKQILEKGVTAAFDHTNGKLGLKSTNVLDRIAWTQKKLVLKSTLLPDLLKRLERIYNVEISHKTKSGMGNERFSGIIDLHQPLDSVLLIIFNPSLYKIQQEGRRFIIKKR